MSSQVDLQGIKETLIAVAREAGAIILAKSGTVTFDNKKNAVDLVTAIDREVEKLVAERLAAAYPSYSFMGEESFVPGQSKLDVEPTFIVDPIDGTTNFIHFFPHSCISLGFALDRKPVVGVVYNPALDQLFVGVKGQGSTMNGQSLPLRMPKTGTDLALQGSLCAIEWGSDRTGANYECKLATFASLGRDESEGGAFVQGFRSMGSAALNMCAVAAGQLDSYWEGGCYAWDVCAGWIILEEAGGLVVSGNKDIWTPPLTERVYLAIRAAPKEQQRQYVKDFWSHIKGTLVYEH